ncbi:hypothetical protein GE09DRAFT_1272263 [Coniochaeta sp. 2T2.1]|nr:hypothetical protein GE09DRAFT_1272263 [Coniochaeta sp. 2T2.1]
MASRQTTTWTPETTLDLFACLLNDQPPTQAQIRAVRERMHAMGHTCSQKAITHQFAKIRQREKGGTKDTDEKTEGKKKLQTSNTPGKKNGSGPRGGGKKRAADESVEENGGLGGAKRRRVHREVGGQPLNFGDCETLEKADANHGNDVMYKETGDIQYLKFDEDSDGEYVPGEESD